jgi:hypothetical protein
MRTRHGDSGVVVVMSVAAPLLLSSGYSRTAAPMVLACVVVLPIALFLASINWMPGRRGLAFAGLDRVYALLMTESHELLLVEHAQRRRPSRWTLPGGAIQPTDADATAMLARLVGPSLVAAIQDWRLVHVEDHGGRVDRVYAGRVTGAAVAAGQAEAALRMGLVHLSRAALHEIDPYPAVAAQTIRELLAAGGDVESLNAAQA